MTHNVVRHSESVFDSRTGPGLLRIELELDITSLDSIGRETSFDPLDYVQDTVDETERFYTVTFVGAEQSDLVFFWNTSDDALVVFSLSTGIVGAGTNVGRVRLVLEAEPFS